MAIDPVEITHQDDAVHVIDAALDHLAQLARSQQTTPHNFFAEVIEQLSLVLSPLSAEIWTLGPESELVPVSHQRQLDFEFRWNDSAKSQLLTVFAGEYAANFRLTTVQGEIVVVASPIRLRDESWGLLSVCLEHDGAAPQAVQRILNAACEICADFLNNREISHFGEIKAYWEDLQKYSLSAHSSLEVKRVAYQIVNDARVLLECDRVTLFNMSGWRPRLLALSSVAVVERKSSVVRAMTGLVNAAMKYKQPIFSDDDANPPRLASQLERFAEQSGLSFIGLVPVHSLDNANRLLGVLVVEAENDERRIAIVRRLNQVLPQASSALNNALLHSSIPLRRPLLGLAWLLSAFRLRNLPRSFLLTALLIAAVCVLVFVKTDLTVRVDGELRPVNEISLFSPMDSVVADIVVEHGAQVQRDELVATMRSQELEMELQRISGELKKIDQQLETKQITLNQAATGNVGDRLLVNQLASDIAALEQDRDSLLAQQDLLEAKQRGLKIYSPIDGQVITWKVERTLRDRPVRRGDAIMKIADVQGDWNVVFEVPDYRVGYLFDAAAQLAPGESLKLNFFLESAPAHKYEAEVLQFAESTAVDPQTGPTVTMVCSVPKEQLDELRHGASVIGKVNCGRVSVGYAWTHELIDSVRRRFVW